MILSIIAEHCYAECHYAECLGALQTCLLCCGLVHGSGNVKYDVVMVILTIIQKGPKCCRKNLNWRQWKQRIMKFDKIG
jgi:hypothetical protein